MNRLRASAAYRVAFTYSAAFALAVLVLGLAAYFAADAEFRQQQDAALAAEVSELLRDYDVEGSDELRRDIGRRELGNAANVFGYALIGANGRRTAGALGVPAMAAGWHDMRFGHPAGGTGADRALASRLRTGETLVVAIDNDALEQIDRIIIELFTIGFVAVLLIGLVGALLLGRFLRARLEGIGDTAAAIAAGHLGERVPVGPRRDEFDRLGAAINAMLDRIAQLMENLHQVSSDIAHDLRTPLGRLRAGLEGAMELRDPGMLRERIRQALRQSDELLSLFGAILRIAEVERGALRAGFAPIDLGDLADDLADTYAPAIGDGGRRLRVKRATGVTVRGDRALLAQAVGNLLDNAQLHTPRGTRIAIDVEETDDAARLSVGDNGLGVPANDRERITRRFVRLESSRTTPGHGLGLAMVSAVAHAHGGTLEIGDNAPGLRVTLVLPRAA